MLLLCSVGLPVSDYSTLRCYYMKLKIALVGTSIIFGMYGCISVPYGPAGSRGFIGGYSDEKIAEGVYAVRFGSNAYNKKEQLEEYFHKRATELCRHDKYSSEFRHYTTSKTETYFTGKFAGTTYHKFPNIEGKVICNP